MLHSFHIATVFMWHVFVVDLFSCHALFLLHFIYVRLFSCCAFFMLHPFHFAAFSYCTLFILCSFHIALISGSIFLILSKILVIPSEYFNCQEQPLAGVLLYEKDALKNFAKFTGKHLYRSVFLIHLLATT